MKKEDDDIPLISIIIPIYNSYKLIGRCLKSLENQTNKNFEVIFIDDCSTDNSYENLKEKLREFSFDYQIHRNHKNSGPGISRNNGIENSRAKYLTFIDSDDYVSETFIEKIENIIKENNPDAIIVDFYREINNKYNVRDSLPLKENNILTTMDTLALSKGMCWGKVYKKSIIDSNNITFPSLIRSEDLAFSKVYLSKCKEVYYLREPLYYYVDNNQSIMHTKSTMDISNNIKAFEYIEKNVKKNQAVEMIFIREYLYLIVQNMILQNSSLQEIKRFVDECNNKYPKWFKNCYIKFQPLYVRIILLLIKYKIIFPIKIIFKLKK